jgi:hypothetical protein
VTLPATDLEYLTDRGISYQVTVDQGMTCVIFPGWSLPAGYVPAESDLLLRLHAGYPDVAPDMWWFAPAVGLTDGRAIEATQASENHVGRTWQRWSRHFPAGQWQSGIDGLESFLALIRRELDRCAARP